MKRNRSMALAAAGIALLGLEAATLVAAAPQVTRYARQTTALQTVTRVLGQTVPSAVRSEVEIATTSLIVSGVTRLSDMYAMVAKTAPKTKTQCELARCPKAEPAKAVPAVAHRRHLLLIGEPI